MINNKSKTTLDIETDIPEPQLNILLTTDEDDSRPVYLSGNFNNWHTQDPKFEMEKIGNGLYHYKFENEFFDQKDPLRQKMGT